MLSRFVPAGMEQERGVYSEVDAHQSSRAGPLTVRTGSVVKGENVENGVGQF